MLGRECNICLIWQPTERFYKQPRFAQGRAYQCIDCTKVSARHRRIRSYGLEPYQYEEMLTASDGRCNICQEQCHKKLSIDHDHVTGRVRGLLCHKCNVALGLFRDSPELLVTAARYLR